MNISVELVPNNKEKLEEELQTIKSRFPQVNMINIPDLTRYETRSYEACASANAYYNKKVPHIRSIDFDYNEPLPFVDTVIKNNIQDVLVVKGDLPQNMSKKVYTTYSIDMIHKIKKELPHVKVYAAIDQYRSSMKTEYEYIQQKLNAGADGFFTQPFFDDRFLSMYADMLKGIDVFMGIAPVYSKVSANYWRTKNDVVFPSDFEPTKEWNIEFAKNSMELIEKQGNHIYFMPIIVDPVKYLGTIFS